MKPCHPARSRARFILIPLFGIAFVTVVTVVVHALWNGVLTEVTGVKPVSYWQALGLFILAKILFGGFGRGGRHCGPFWRKHRLMHEYASLPPEKREEWRNEMRRRFGSWPRPCWGEAEDECDAGPRSPEAPKA